MIANAILPRPEWDLPADCPAEHLWRCWSYEFSRHVGWVIDAYRAGAPATFDEFNNWRCSRMIGEPDDGKSLDLSLIPGFPDMPFLEALKGARFPKYPKFRTTSVHPDAKRPGPFERLHTIAIKWDQPDETILNDFADALKKMRPHPARNRRGRSDRRKCEADLKALGAYRLLESGMTAKQAIAYTRRIAGQSLYKQESEWFTAKKRAASIIAEIASVAPLP